jgi:hypothetical protein
MEIEIPNQNGLPPQGLKQNQDQSIPAKAVPKPEVTITNPISKAQMPGPMPLSLAAAEEVDKWVQAHAPGQNSLQPGMVELSTEHRHFYIDQIDLIRPTFFGDAPAIIFRYQDRTTGQVQVVIIKLDRRDHAIALARAIAWRRIQVFPCGQFVEGTDDNLTNCPPFDPAKCVDNFLTKQWQAAAAAKLTTDRAAIALPLEKASQQVEALTERVTLEERQRNAVYATLIETEDKLKREHDRAGTWKLCTQWIVIIIIFIFIIHHLWPSL